MVNNVEKAQDSYKSRIAQKWGVPVVSVDFVSACVEAEKLLEVDAYVVVGKTAAEEFSSGKIMGELSAYQVSVRLNNNFQLLTTFSFGAGQSQR